MDGCCSTPLPKGNRLPCKHTADVSLCYKAAWKLSTTSATSILPVKTISNNPAQLAAHATELRVRSRFRVFDTHPNHARMPSQPCQTARLHGWSLYIKLLTGRQAPAGAHTVSLTQGGATPTGQAQLSQTWSQMRRCWTDTDSWTCTGLWAESKQPARQPVVPRNCQAQVRVVLSASAGKLGA